MEADDFFKKMDSKLESIKSAEEIKTNSQQELSDFIEKKIKELTPILESYKKKLKERSISCELKISDRGFSLIMYYKDGGYHGIIFGRETDFKDNSYVFKSSFTNDNGRNCTGTNGVPITEENWSKKDVEAKVQKAIDDFLFYADRHGGY